MDNFFNRLFYKTKYWDFPGGIYPHAMKQQSNCTPLSHISLPKHFIIFLKQHIGFEGEICVNVGEKVLRGQPLTFGEELPVHAPTSGIIESIGSHIATRASGLLEACIFLKPDGKDEWMPRKIISNYEDASREEILECIHNSGIAGLGGAGFPTATKLRIGLKKVKTLIINAAECEPYITADERLIQDYTNEVLEGCEILSWIVEAKEILIGIEDNKYHAIHVLQDKLHKKKLFRLCIIPSKYPSGGSKQLTKILTGLEVPQEVHLSDIGIIMHNVSTALAVKRAVIDGEPLTERVVTITGKGIIQPKNIWVRLGTPIYHILNEVGLTHQPSTVIMGGPLMGFKLPSLKVPVIKMTNCILVPANEEIDGEVKKELPCIRCSACADVCPLKLLPQQLYWYIQGKDYHKARIYNVEDCIECGACSYVCPSKIPLVKYFNQAKNILCALDLEQATIAESKNRFERRQQRLFFEKQNQISSNINNNDEAFSEKIKKSEHRIQFIKKAIAHSKKKLLKNLKDFKE